MQTDKTESREKSVLKAIPSPEAVDQRIREIESKHDLLRFKVDGWCIWPLFRFDAALALLKLPRVKTGNLSRGKRYELALRDLLNLMKIRKTRYIVKTFSSCRSEYENGLAKDIYFDDLLKELDNYFKIESVNNPSFANHQKILIPADLTTAAVEIITEQLARTGGPAYLSEVARSLSECLKSEKRLEDFTFQRVKSRLLYFYWAKRLWARILKQIQPKYLFVADFGEYELVAAAKEKAIKVIEFQHGIINKYCFGYSWSSYALPHKKTMPVPDKLFLYGTYGQEELSSNGFWNHEVISVGSPRVDGYRSSRFNDGKPDVCTILLTTQGIDIQRIITFVSKFVEQAKGKLEYKLFIKLHPVYETDKQPYLKALGTAENVEVLLGSEPPSTFELLIRSHLHVSIFSHCHYEALALGIPTVILPFADHGNVLHLHQAGDAYLVNTPAELVRLALQWRTLKVPQEVGEKYFEAEALENIKAELGLNGKAQRSYRQCSRCVLDTSVEDIRFDSKGVCNYCRNYDEEVYKRGLTDEKAKKERLEKIISEIKSSGAGKKYDCLIGLSGGTDSTYLVYLAKKLGLCPLAMHFDNGWDSELAVRNIAHVTRKLDVDLHSYVINWEEFKDLQLAYLKAAVVDIEVPTDQLIFASLYRVAHQKGIKYILCGNNHVTEFTMPTGWNHPMKLDYVNLRNIHRKYGTRKLKNFPKLGYFERYFYDKVVRIRRIDLLDFVPYDKEKAKRILIEELGWRDYGYKHYESIFTRFYQGYILPRKFHIDKRKAHLSNLICSGQMTKEEALAELKKDSYPLEQQKADKEYVAKKLGLSEQQFEILMGLPARSHDDFGRERDYLKYPRIIFQRAKALLSQNGHHH